MRHFLDNLNISWFSLEKIPRRLQLIMMLPRLIFSICACFAAGNILQSANIAVPSVFDNPTIRMARDLHDGAVTASRKEVEESEKRLFKLLEKEPKNELLRAYAGSLLTIKSGKSFPGPTALRIFKEGVRMMNEAVENAPDDIYVRLIRAMNHYELPSFFNRRKQARQDFKWLLSAINALEGNQVCETTVGVIYYYAGLCLRETNDKQAAVEIWREGLGKIKNPEWRMKIARELGDSTAVK